MSTSGYRTSARFNGTGTALTAAFIIILVTFITNSQTAAMNTETELNIHVFDVGQGDAMLLHQPGTCSLLIDAGPLINGHRITNKIGELGIESLDMVIITHPHLDHFGGLFDLLPRIPVNHFYDNGISNDAWEYFDDYVTLRDKQPYETLSRGKNLTCGDISLEVLYPLPDPDPQAGINNTSMVLLISFGDFKLLHMGDLAGDGEKRFLERGNIPQADIVKIAHHGAIDSTSEKLLQKVSPKQVLLSTAEQNRIGSPAKEVLDRLDRHSIPCYRTDRTGDIVIRVQSGGYQINTEKERLGG